ncbi:hypothetical protein A3A46_00590 [Candidatus Roizmanbacteria bacterium RIFCSPLOWO2_01_FULL_37_13]|uniref:HTH luxR-type domain-containing protein n=1 Tax=Candidatus Roizmanbacteria bacterium RIFCSPHIGHO2_02_FULL_38_11 TaxID=1802039 RepID=A0A1F7H174_9BACT|nr:MAG: hypothetical protein A3C25_02450 [Candidatus Roizmanbacteria bacterium RIFCSPHIGHO2_02_FULL_38_11]OGK34278.1 MAG: hypothetical protein A3F58_00910 [Candidatus Roizmanbacteria bacterium RIFCSPHIGHO2_12_FULL_37_9b]OGK43235.1 MAG: hypothetical protein A3A46_00590 [Candidatus Roizmanbacteria bacterium RIFCSPLOWO2_01_FULL_37_13]
MQVLSDKEVIIRIKNGEIDYFAHIVKRYTKRIYNYVFKKISNREDVEDIVQNSFVQLYKAVGRLDQDKQVLPYLYEIVRNEMKMFWRARKASIPLDEEIASEEKEEYPETDLIEKQLVRLPKEQRKALKLVSEGYSYKEIAKYLSRPINTVRTIIRRARLRLSKLKTHEKT